MLGGRLDHPRRRGGIAVTDRHENYPADADRRAPEHAVMQDGVRRPAG